MIGEPAVLVHDLCMSSTAQEQKERVHIHARVKDSSSHVPDGHPLEGVWLALIAYSYNDD